MMADVQECALAAVEIFCDALIPLHVGDEVRLSCGRRGNAITIVEERAPWKPELTGGEWTQLKIAQLRYDASGKIWSLRLS